MVLHPLFDEKKTMSCQQEMCGKIQKNCQLCRKICNLKIQANCAQSIIAQLLFCHPWEGQHCKERWLSDEYLYLNKFELYMMTPTPSFYLPRRVCTMHNSLHGNVWNATLRNYQIPPSGTPGLLLENICNGMYRNTLYRCCKCSIVAPFQIRKRPPAKLLHVDSLSNPSPQSAAERAFRSQQRFGGADLRWFSSWAWSMCTKNNAI